MALTDKYPIEREKVNANYWPDYYDVLLVEEIDGEVIALVCDRRKSFWEGEIKEVKVVGLEQDAGLSRRAIVIPTVDRDHSPRPALEDNQNGY